MPPKKHPLELELSDDDLDELYSDDGAAEDEDVKPGDRRRGKNAPGPSTLLRDALAKPRHTLMNTKHLHDLIHFGAVYLDAPYQRDVVWPETKMIQLIGSLFLNYYIPPLIFAVETSPENGDEVRVCIDGKQRCTSILYFMDGRIPFIPSGTRDKYWYTSPPKHGKQLPDGYKRRFDQIQMQAVEYDDLSDVQQRDIFQRVQMGVALSAPEKLQAIPGPWSEWLVSLQKMYILEEGTIADKLDKFDVARARAFQGLAAFIMLAYEPGRTSMPSYATMTKFLARADPPDPSFQRKVERALALFVEIAQEHHEEAFGTVGARVAPVEFWFISLLIYTHMAYMSVTRLAHTIGQLRSTIRARNQDIRANTRVGADCRAFLASVPKKRLRDEQVAAEEYEGDEANQRAERAAKRARQEEENDASYLGDAVDRYSKSDAATGTRAQQAARAGNSTTRRSPPNGAINNLPPRPSSGQGNGLRPAPTTAHAPQRQAPPPPPPAVRPAASSMDAPRSAAQVPATFGYAPQPPRQPAYNQQPQPSHPSNQQSQPHQAFGYAQAQQYRPNAPAQPRPEDAQASYYAQLLADQERKRALQQQMYQQGKPQGR